MPASRQEWLVRGCIIGVMFLTLTSAGLITAYSWGLMQFGDGFEAGIRAVETQSKAGGQAARLTRDRKVLCKARGRQWNFDAGDCAQPP